jgi:hypothetical protein
MDKIITPNSQRFTYHCIKPPSDSKGYPTVVKRQEEKSTTRRFRVLHLPSAGSSDSESRTKEAEGEQKQNPGD